jgi:hypothetical protein
VIDLIYLDVDYRLCITWIIRQHVLGYKIEEKLRRGGGGAQTKKIEYHCYKLWHTGTPQIMQEEFTKGEITWIEQFLPSPIPFSLLPPTQCTTPQSVCFSQSVTLKASATNWNLSKLVEHIEKKFIFLHFCIARNICSNFLLAWYYHIFNEM